jgi:valyl-tRNA synthetase
MPEGMNLEETIAWKSDISKSFPSHYDPSLVETHWNEWWEKKRFYCPDAKEAASREYDDKFIMVIPPPNITGALHIGHALTNAIEDCMTRWNRMRGKLSIWVPGCDHAGIAT